MQEKTANPTMTMPMLALRGLVLFPHIVLHFDIGREKSIKALETALAGNRRIYLAAQKDVADDDPGPQGLYSVGVVAEIKQVIRARGESARVMVEGLYRAKTVQLHATEPYLLAEVVPYPTRRLRRGSAEMADALMRTVKELFEEYAYLTPKMPKELMLAVMMAQEPEPLAEHIAGNIPLSLEAKQQILAQSDPLKRLEQLAVMLQKENEILGLEHDIYDRVKDQMDKNQREYYLREQMRVIASELGEGEAGPEEVSAYVEKIRALGLPQEHTDKLIKEAERLGKMPGSSQEAAVIRGYLDICLELPWNKETKDKIDIPAAARLLDAEHYGLQKVKERILESMAVRKMAPDIKGQILCLVGPPGVGKTSVARSIAKAMGRKYVRLSLGGVRDESDIRGHRKTYVGSMPGRIINAMRQAGSKNPLMLLDEVDKLGNDFRGDPSSALLEVLDGEQNNAFRDHFIELPFDLSQVLFIATANTLETIPAPLLDRMEVITLSSYTREEKFQIAKRHLLPKQMARHGLNGRQVRVTDDALYALIDFYTREAGVRSLEREIASLLRKTDKAIVSGEAKKRVTITAKELEGLLGPQKFKPDALATQDEVGVCNGLAWTSVGGEMLQIEVAVMEGSGKLELTGSLGDVMKESAHAAISFIRSHAGQYGVDPHFYKDKDIHIHVPEGAVPKDGPSAGITICTALLSALTGMPIRRDVAMTGEITLRGRVLPIGGLKEKTMAAYRTGMHTVVIPADNQPDLAEVDPVVREAIRFVPARRVETVFETALLPRQPEPEQPVELALPAVPPPQGARTERAPRC